ARGCAHEPRDVADAQALVACGVGAPGLHGYLTPAGAVSGTSALPVAWRGRIRHTPTPSSETAASTHRATCMLEMNGASLAAERPWASPEKTANSVALGIAEVTIASTNAIDSTAPVFCSSVRAPAATPRRCAGTTPIIAAVLGLLNMPDPTPTVSSHRALCQ